MLFHWRIVAFHEKSWFWNENHCVLLEIVIFQWKHAHFKNNDFSWKNTIIFNENHDLKLTNPDLRGGKDNCLKYDWLDIRRTRPTPNRTCATQHARTSLPLLGARMRYTCHSRQRCTTGRHAPVSMTTPPGRRRRSAREKPSSSSCQETFGIPWSWWSPVRNKRNSEHAAIIICRDLQTY